MPDKQSELLRELTNRSSALTHEWSAYWKSYSGYDTWQFWFIVAIFALPLLALVLFMDRKRAFRLGFYGLATHMIAVYVDMYATSHRMWEYPYNLSPLFPFSFGLDAALIPVAYMFVYQWTLNRRKNYYLYIGLLAAAFTFLFKPLLSYLELFRFVESNYFQLFLLYLVGGLLSKWLADLFQYAQKSSGSSAHRGS
ncbi:CBO0543 family protein [Paenibacillus sp.]|uniref:CBO0543 family protein n=1 Tax=Paenibacillus sp. TaxID=58172 RepID=UPI0028113AD3|nr:CBO0543 family protein [Paenibacillus sp.]